MLLALVVGISVPSARGQVPGVVFSAYNYLGATSSHGTVQDFSAAFGRISADLRGDVFFANNNFSGNPDNVVEVLAGTNTEVVILTNVTKFTPSVTIDSQGNLWALNGQSQLSFVPYIYGTYPTDIDASMLPPCVLPATTSTVPCAWPNINAASIGYFAELTDIAIDPNGNIYGVDRSASGGNRILEYDATSGNPTIVLDGLPSSVNGRLALAANGDIYYVDQTNLYYSAAGSGTFTTISGYGGASGVSIDGGGNIYVTDTANNRVAVLPNINGAVSLSSAYTILSGQSNGSTFSSVAIDGFGKITWGGGGYAGDFYRTQVGAFSLGTEGIGSSTSAQDIDMFFTETTVFGSFKLAGGSGSTVPFTLVTNGCVVGQTYNAGTFCSVTVAYTASAPGPQAGELQAYDGSGNLLGVATLSGYGDGPLLDVDPGTVAAIGSGWKTPTSIAVDAQGNNYVVDGTTGSVYKNGNATAIASGLNNPSAVVVDGVGNLYVADSGNNRIVEIPFSGTAYGAAVSRYSGTQGATGLAIDSAGDLYVADSGNGRVLLLAPGGDLPTGSDVSVIGGGFTTPVGVAVDSLGNVYVSDSGTEEIVQYSIPSGITSPIVTGLTAAGAIAVDPGGSVFYVDNGTKAITRVPNVGGGVNASDSTVIGALVAAPSSLAIDGGGNLYATDSTDGTVGSSSRTIGLLDFGLVVAPSASQPFSATVSNGGTATLTLGTPYYTASGSTDFAVQGSSTCSDGATVPVGSTCTIAAVFTPSQSQSESSLLTLASNANPASIALQGIGTALINVTLTGAATVVYGNKVTYQVTATEDGTYKVNITGASTASASVVISGGTGSFMTPVLHVGSYTLGLAGTIGTASLSVTPATLTATTGNATRQYGTANPVFTSTIMGAVNGDSFIGSATTPATLLSNVGTYPIVPNAVGSASGNYVVNAVDGVLTVTQASSNTAVSISSSTNGFLGGNVTFTATVLSLTSGTPTGTVTFEDATNTAAIKVLGTGTLSGGVATFTTSTLAAGTIYVQAVYAGDANFVTSSSVPTGVTISLPSFTLSSTPETLQIVQGQSGMTTISVIPVANFSSAIVFSCSGLPLEATCSFASPSVTPTTGNAIVTDVLTINTVSPSSSSAALRHAAPWKAVGGSTVLAFMIGTFAGFRRKRFAKGLCLFLFVSLLCLLPMTGCGLQQQHFVTPLGISTVTITGASAANNTFVSTSLRLAVTTSTAN